MEKDAAYIRSVAEKYRPVRLLFGMPRNMDGSYGFQSEKVRAFADAVLAEWDGEHVFYDERLSTVSAERVLCEAERTGKNGARWWTSLRQPSFCRAIWTGTQNSEQ